MQQHRICETKEAIAWIGQFRVALQPYVMGSYINVPDRSIADLRTYYGDNLVRLRQVKCQYNPENVFQFEQSLARRQETGHRLS